MTATTVTTRTFSGNPPPPTDGWGLAHRVSLPEEGEWDVYTRNTTKHEGWIGIKMVAKLPAPIKGNYWLSWNGKSFGRNRDTGLLYKNRKPLFRALRAALRTGSKT